MKIYNSKSSSSCQMMIVLLLVLVPVNLFAAEKSKPKKPLNVVFILIDDMGWMDLSCQGSKFYETPNIDRLAKNGMRFTNAYAACAVCSPTRAAVLTGRYPGRIGVTDWIRARFQSKKTNKKRKNPTGYVGGKNRKLLCPPNPYWMEQEEITIAEILKQKGYKTCHLGKWHLGDDDWYPQKQGFDVNFGGCDYGQPPSYFDPYRNKRLQRGIPFLPPRKQGEYLTDRLTDEAIGFIKKHKDQPFFIHLAHYAVHTPIQAKKSVTKKYEAKRKDGLKNPAYAAMVESVDDSVGRVLKTLDELNLTENTLVIFTSDNGGLDRKGSPTENAPLRSGKGYAYEGGIRVPLIIRWPQVVQPQTISDEPISSVDYLPTIVAATNAQLPKNREIDGVSLIEHLKSGGTKKLPRTAIYWHFPHYRHAPGPYSIIRDGSWKLIKFYEGPTYELYNLNDDLGEKNNLASKIPKKVKQLNTKLMSHLQKINAKLPKVNPDYKRKKK